MTQAELEARAVFRTIWLVTAMNAGVVSLQFWWVTVAESFPFEADAFHNLGDLLVLPMVVVGYLAARAGVSAIHPEGRGALEDVGRLGVAAFIALTGVYLVYETIARLISGSTPSDRLWEVIGGAAFVTGMNLAAGTIQRRVGLRHHVAILKSAGDHARADAWASAVPALSAIVTWAGTKLVPASGALGPWIAGALRVVEVLAVAAIVWMIAHLALETARPALRRLQNPQDVPAAEQVSAVARSVEGVDRVEYVRARWAGTRRLTVIVSVCGGSLLLRRQIEAAVVKRLGRERPRVEFTVLVFVCTVPPWAHPGPSRSPGQ